MKKLPSVLVQPIRDKRVPDEAQWLAGEGAGSWFNLVKADANQFTISRYSEAGIIECESLFLTYSDFNFETPFAFTYPSHCALATVIQNKGQIKFTRIEGNKTSPPPEIN